MDHLGGFETMASFLISITEAEFVPQNTNGVVKGDTVTFLGVATTVTVSSESLFGTKTVETPVTDLKVLGSGAHFGISASSRGAEGETKTMHGTINVWRE